MPEEYERSVYKDYVFKVIALAAGCTELKDKIIFSFDDSQKEINPVSARLKKWNEIDISYKKLAKKVLSKSDCCSLSEKVECDFCFDEAGFLFKMHCGYTTHLECYGEYVNSQKGEAKCPICFKALVEADNL